MNENQKKADSLAWLFIVMVAVYLALMIIVNLLGSKNITLPTNLSLILGESVMLIPAIVYMLKNNMGIREGLGFRKIKIGTFFIVVFLGFTAIPIAGLVNVLSQFFVKNTMTQASDAILDGPFIITLFIMAVFGPLCEEVAFRGVIQNGYDRVSTPLKAILMSALLFGFMHMNVNQTCYAIVLGIIFSVVNKVAGSTYPSCIMHFIMNAVNVLMLYVASMFTGEDTNIADAAEATRGNMSQMIVIAVVYAVLAAICIGISIPLIMLIGHIEGRDGAFGQIFTGKKDKEVTDDSDESEVTEGKVKVLLSVPGIVAVVLSLIIIFGLEPIMAALGWA